MKELAQDVLEGVLGATKDGRVKVFVVARGTKKKGRQTEVKLVFLLVGCYKYSRISCRSWHWIPVDVLISALRSTL